MGPKIIKPLSLIMGGITFRDKLLIFLWLINQKKGLKNYVYIKNKIGLFYFPKGYGVWESSIYDGEEMKPYFNIKDGIFIDIGANIGKYTLMLSKKLKDKGIVIAVEPEKKNFSILKKNVELNKLDNVFLENVAIANKNKTVNFYMANDPGKHSITRKTEKKVLVKGVKLDDLIKKYKVKNINLIKIDVETAEIEVLKGSLKTIKKFHPNLIIEITKENLEKVKNLLLEYNFKKISKIDYYFYKEQNNKKFKEK